MRVCVLLRERGQPRAPLGHPPPSPDRGAARLQESAITIPILPSLPGFIARFADSTTIGKGEAWFYACAEIEQWHRQPSGEFTKLDAVLCDVLLFGRLTESAYDRFSKGDELIAAGYVNQYVRQRDGESISCEESFALRLRELPAPAGDHRGNLAPHERIALRRSLP